MDRRGQRDRDDLGRRPAPRLAAQDVAVDERREQLLDEQRVPLRTVDDVVADGVGEVGLAEQVVEQALRLGLAERLEEDGARVRLASTPARPLLEQLGPRRADEENGRVARHLGHALDHVQERGLGPVQVVEDDDERPLAGEPLEGPRTAAAGSSLEVEVAGRLDERLVRARLPVRPAAAVEHGRDALDTLGELAHEPRLPDAGRAEHGEEMQRAVGDRALERARERGELAASADERRVET